MDAPDPAAADDGERAPARRRVLAGAFLAAVAAVGLSACDPTTCEGKTPTIRGTNASETIHGTPGDDVILALGGDDTVHASGGTDVVCGDAGHDSLLGGDGDERLVGGAGNDVLDGNQGADTLVGGPGFDLVQWDPGEANDTVDGGDEADRLVVNGSGAAEAFALAPVDGRLRLTRDVGAVALDVDGVEDVDLRALRGTDTVTLADLTGTDVTTVTTDLAAPGGGDDAEADAVVVPPGTVVGRDGAVATVDLPTARVRVRGGAPIDRVQVTGTSAADVVRVAGTAGAEAVAVTADGTDVRVDGATPGLHLRLTGMELLDADLAAGDDAFTAVGNVAPLVALDVDGGEGRDTIAGGNGADVLAGGPGDDALDGNQAADALRGGPGLDSVQWDPGDGSDTVDGGADADRLLFNGSATTERLDVSAVAGHVRLARDVAGIVLDLAGVERAELRPLAGPDTVAVSDLTSTDLDELVTDLAPAGGGDDGQADVVAVPPGLVVGRDGPAAVVDGLGARLRVLNGAATDGIHLTGASAPYTLTLAGTAGPDAVAATADGAGVRVDGATPGVHVRMPSLDLVAELLQVDLAAGDDTFTAVGNLAPLVALDVDGGEGRDTILGGNGPDVLAGGAGDDVLDGNQGVDTVRGDAGLDSVQWDPGDGNDAVDGGADADRLLFNGSAANERLTLSGVADHVRLARDVAGIVLDLDGIEAADVRAFGGTDTVDVGDLAGTDLAELVTDLGLPGATGADGVADAVVVNGTAGDDRIAVVDEGAAAVVRGLASVVRVVRADPTLDRLRVDGLQGDDLVTATPGAGALVVLDLAP